MKKIRNLLIICALLIIILFIVLSQIKKKEIEGQFQIFEGESDPSQGILHIEEALSEEENISSFYMVNNLTKNFISNINKNNQKTIEAMLDSSAYNIDYTNLKTDTDNFYLQRLLVAYNLENIEYYVYGLVEKNNNLNEFCAIIYLDRTNSTFAISPISYETFVNASDGSYEKLEKKEIKSNNYNMYMLDDISLQDRVELYWEDFIIKAKYNPELAYKLLDENYRKSKFVTLDSFSKFLQNNLPTFQNLKIENVGNYYSDKTVEYSCSTDIGRTIIIKEKKLMTYTIMLDN